MNVLAMEPMNVTRRRRLVSMSLEPTAAVVNRASTVLLEAYLATVNTDTCRVVLYILYCKDKGMDTFCAIPQHKISALFKRYTAFPE